MLAAESFSLENVTYQNVPHGNDMADATRQYAEMEHGMHIFRLVKRIEDGTCDIEDTLKDNPYKSIHRNGVNQWLKGS